MTVDATNVFGPAIIKTDVEAAVIATLKLWFPTYLAEFERRTGRDHGVLPPPRSWLPTNTMPRHFAGPFPAVIVISTGIPEKPVQQGDGTLTAWWDVNVAIIVKANEPAASRELSGIYAAALRLMLLQKQSLDGFAAQIEFNAEADDAVPDDYVAAGWASVSAFQVLTHGVVTRYGGPKTPDTDPGPLVQFETAEIISERRRPQ